MNNNIKQNKCLKCKIAPCMKTCPINNNIPEIMKLYDKELYREAYDLLVSNNPLFMLCNKLCDHERFCGKNCLHKKVDSERFKFEKVEIDLFERYKFDFPFTTLLKEKKVLVIGAGPAGLSSAIHFRLQGYQVKVIDAYKHLGGTIYQLIPSFRYDTNILLELENYLKDYIDFEFNKKVESLDMNTFEEYDHIMIGIGTSSPINFLNNEDVFIGHKLLDNIKNNNYQISNKKIAVLGLGNVAIDCARSLKRLGNDVEIIYRRTVDNAPASIEELEELKEEKIDVKELLGCVSFENHLGKFQVMKLSDEVINGRRSFIKTNKFIELPFDYLVEAYGSKPNYDLLLKDIILKDFVVNNKLITNNIGKLYFIGDFYTGASSIVESISNGKKITLNVIDNDKVLEEIKNHLDNKPIVYGGSFNPFTLAHMQIYYYLYYNLSKNILLLPNANNYPTKELLDYQERVDLIKLSLNNIDYIIDDSETKQDFKGTYLYLKNNNHPLFVMGSDNLRTIDKWINHDELIRENKFIVIKRSNDECEEIIENNPLLKENTNNLFILNIDVLPISSTNFRVDFNQELVKKEVYDEIIKKSYYK